MVALRYYSAHIEDSAKDPAYQHYVYSRLILWLEDNIDQDSALHFDNEGKVKSEHVLAVLEAMEPERSET